MTKPAFSVIHANLRGENVYVNDNVHWNPYGQRMMADGLIPYIREHIARSSKAHLLNTNSTTPTAATATTTTTPTSN